MTVFLLEKYFEFMQNIFLTNNSICRILIINMKMLWQGKSILPLEFQRAAGWWEAVPGMIQLALEQPPERRSLSVGADGISAVIRGAVFAFTGWCDRVGAVAPMRMVPRKLRFRFLITGNESVFCYQKTVPIVSLLEKESPQQLRKEGWQ